MKFEMTEKGFKTETAFGVLTISSDEDFGFRPFQLLVSSLAVCSGGVLRKVLEKMRMPAEDIAIEVREVLRNPGEANKLEKVHLHFIITNSKIDRAKMPRVMDLTRKSCAMVQSVSGSIEVVESYEII